MQSFNVQAKERKVSRRERSGGSVIKTPGGKKRSISIKLAIVARWMRQRFDSRVEEVGLTRAQWSVLAVVSRKPGATQRTLAELLSVTDVTAGRMIDRLCNEGYIERRENPNDRRAYRVYLADAARPVLARLTKLATQFEDDLFEGFTDDDMVRLDQLLAVMTRNLAKSQPRRVANGD